MFVVADGQGWVEAASRLQPGYSTAFPSTEVFRMDRALLKALSDAYATGERARLARLWKLAAPHGPKDIREARSDTAGQPGSDRAESSEPPQI